jgi:hypothetical protein
MANANGRRKVAMLLLGDAPIPTVGLSSAVAST